MRETLRQQLQCLRRDINNTSNLQLTGRTTFVNTLCGKSVLDHKESDDAGSAHVEDGVKIKPITVGTYIQLPLQAYQY
jgi:septin family protein